jgi:hypothetical protein
LKRGEEHKSSVKEISARWIAATVQSRTQAQEIQLFSQVGQNIVALADSVEITA